MGRCRLPLGTSNYKPSQEKDFTSYWGYAKLKMFGLSEPQKRNRKLLSIVMKNAGFIPLSYEWWHFNGMPKDEARKQYAIIE
jgi:D-alanyl-D-alanine dipeptidase